MIRLNNTTINKMQKFKRKSGIIEAYQFPDNGPEQHEISTWVKKTVKCSLYNGCIETNIKTSTDANWHWSHISIEGIYEWAKIGDWIVKDIDGKIRIFDNETFNKLFKETNNRY